MDNPYLSSPTSLLLPEAPGAKAARVCGILAIVFALTCIGLPVALVLGIVAIVQSGKAKRATQAEPGVYRTPSSAGLVMGIVGLVLSVVMVPMAGIVSAIAIPALLSQRARARDKVAIEQMVGALGDLVGQYDQLAEAKTAPGVIPDELDRFIARRREKDANPWKPGDRSYVWSVQPPGVSRETLDALGRSEARELGQPRFYYSAPVAGQQGYLAGAVRVQNSVNGDHVVVKVVAIE